jgi:subtilase family serine protease
VLFIGGANCAWSQTAASPATITVPASSTSGAPGTAHTNLRYFVPQATTPQAFGPPFAGLLYEDPATLACEYDLTVQTNGCNPNTVTTNPTGGSRAIAIVDAFDDPNAYADLQAFSGQFGVVGINPSSFVVVFAPPGGATPGSCTAGPAPRPPVDPSGGWEVEESLDVQYSHSMAPGATLYLVEAQSNFFSDLFCAVTVASNLVSAAGGGEVSMSWASGEFPQETTYDSIFTTPGVVYIASAGDGPGTVWPSASPNVVSVGGVTLSRSLTGGFQTGENTWQDGGGGPSFFEPRPSYQNGIAGIVGTQRGTPDVALDANPYTGVWVLDDFGCPPNVNCWYIVGGTSVAAPTFAGIVNSAKKFSASTNAELTMMYAAPQSSDFYDITSGTCGPYIGYAATTGWDFCTGLGAPKTYSQK